MPLYEYVCESCHDQFEILVRGHETPNCPTCGGQRLTQQLSVVTAHTSVRNALPVCAPASSAGCGLPQCGGGRCAMGE